MPTPIATATAYLEKLEADRRAAIAVSEQKAEEAKLITARKEGFQVAMEIFADASSVSSCELQYDKSSRRRPLIHRGPGPGLISVRKIATICL